MAPAGASTSQASSGNKGGCKGTPLRRCLSARSRGSRKAVSETPRKPSRKNPAIPGACSTLSKSTWQDLASRCYDSNVESLNGNNPEVATLSWGASQERSNGCIGTSGEKGLIVLAGKVPLLPCKYRSPSSGRLKATQNEK